MNLIPGFLAELRNFLPDFHIRCFARILIAHDHAAGIRYAVCRGTARKRAQFESFHMRL